MSVPNTMMDAPPTCLLCHETDDTVVGVATCTDRCVVNAHESCFRNRRSSNAFRRKNGRRSNGDAEVCLASGCVAKCLVRRWTTTDCGTTTFATGHGERHVDASDDLSDPDHPCSFLGRDGRPCRHPAARSGACRLHLRSADLMLRMVRDVSHEDRNRATMTDVVSTASVGVQTDETFDILEARVKALELENVMWRARQEALRRDVLRTASELTDRATRP